MSGFWTNYNFLGLIAAAGTYATALMFGTIGEVLTEKSGNMNLGVEGIMYTGGIVGLAATHYYEAIVGEASSLGLVAMFFAILGAFLSGALYGLLFSFITVTLRANQNVTGLAMTTFGTGVAKFIGEAMSKRLGGFVSVSKHLKDFFVSKLFPETLQNIPIIGKIVFGQEHFFYLAIILAIAIHLFLSKTKTGLYLRAVGESPVTADAAGINITKYKYLATMIGGGISSIGGMVFIVTTSGCVWMDNSLSGLGWLAVALVIFCTWKPLNAIWGSILFGALMIMYLWIKIPFLSLAIINKYNLTELYKLLPYVVTIIVLVTSSVRNNKEKQPPASLGLNYFREER